VSFVDPNNGMVPVVINGQGSYIWITKDGAKTFTAAPELDPAGLYIGGAMAAVYSGVVTEPLVVQASYETDHWNFTLSDVEPDGDFTSQNVETFSKGLYAATGGDPDAGEGVIFSNDGGVSFQFMKAAPFKTMARYGAFPSDTVWYLSGGEWPRAHLNLAPGETLVREISSRFHIVRDAHGHVHQRRTDHSNGYVGEGNHAGAWKAQIVKSTDGGATWSSVFYDEGKFYFNQISCGSETHCCAVGESDNSTAPGVRIYCTNDGGATWQNPLFVQNPDYSSLAMQFVPGSNTDVWTPVGNMDEESFGGIFYHSTDGGKTWDGSMTIDDVFANCISMVDATHGFATAVGADQQSSFLVFN